MGVRRRKDIIVKAMKEVVMHNINRYILKKKSFYKIGNVLVISTNKVLMFTGYLWKE